MTFDLSSVSKSTRMRAPRIVLLGGEKIGKSTFASQSDNPIFIPVKGEEGIDSIPVAQFPTCQSFADYKQCLYSLYSEAHDYQTVVTDSASTLEALIWKDVCAQYHVNSIEKADGGFQHGYIEALNYWRMLTEAMDSLRNERNMTTILIGHVKVKRFDSPEGHSYDQWQFDINDKAANLLYRWADVILFCNTKIAVTTEDVGFKKEKGKGVDIGRGQRFLYTQKSPAYPAGGRGVYGQLPPELPLNWGSFIDAVARVVQR